MGYYDDHSPPPSRPRRTRWLMPFIVGIVLGAFLFAVLLPSLVNNNLLPYTIITGEQGASTANESSEQQTVPGDVRQVQVDISTAVTDIVQEVAPTVVGVINIQNQFNFWEQNGDGEEGTGSGVIYKIEGDTAYIVTNDHVIQGADQVEVVLSDETRVEASIVGSDLYTDLAVLEMDAQHASSAIEFGSSSDVHVGEPAIAIGNPLGMHLSGSVTQGIISGKQRTIPQDFDMDGRADWQSEVIQTDAAINPGNSGGALLNMEGQLIGINSMKIAQSAVEGIGFAIPIDDAIPVMEELEQNGEVTRAYLGVEAYSLEEVSQIEWRRSLNLPRSVEGGIYVRSVEPGSPADTGGIRAYDVIVELDGNPIEDVVDLRQHLYSDKSVGDALTISYYRDGELEEVTVQLTAIPNN